MADDYSSLLKKAYKTLPEINKATERFEVPKVSGHVEGNKTIINNFKVIVDVVRREQEHLLKYLQRELATPAFIDDSRLVLNRKISSSIINEKIEKYVKTFVLCPECGKPDTQIIKDERLTTIKCQACGAKHPIKAKI